MIVSALPIWVVFLFSLIITGVYYWRYRHISIMNNWLVVLLIFFLHFAFFALGIIVFIIGEIIRSKSRGRTRSN